MNTSPGARKQYTVGQELRFGVSRIMTVISTRMLGPTQELTLKGSRGGIAKARVRPDGSARIVSQGLV